MHVCVLYMDKFVLYINIYTVYKNISYIFQLENFRFIEQKRHSNMPLNFQGDIST